MTIDPSYFF